MAWDFRGGQKVVCVDDRFKDPEPGDILPARGEVYTLRSVEASRHFDTKNPFVRLEEIINPTRAGAREISFEATGFRPLVTDSQPWIAEILAKPPSIKVDAPEPVA